MPTPGCEGPLLNKAFPHGASSFDDGAGLFHDGAGLFHDRVGLFHDGASPFRGEKQKSFEHGKT